MHTTWGLVPDCAFPPFWLWLSELWEQCPGREEGEAKKWGQRWKTKRMKDRQKPGSDFWNRDRNKMVLCYRFYWKLKSSMLQKNWEGKRQRVMEKGGKRNDRTACKGHTAQFTSVKETIWLQFLLLSHSELLNSLFVRVVHVCVTAHVVFLYLCLCECAHVGKCVNMCVCFCVRVWLFGSLCSRCTGLLLCSDILNGWRRHFCEFPAHRMGSPPLSSLLSALL